MVQKTIVITGASDGIGAAAAAMLVAHGHRVIVVGRSPEKTRAVGERIGAPYLSADFGRLADVRALADKILAIAPRIDVLANNAGGVFGKREETEDGFERTFQVNHLAPFLLTMLLLPRLIESRASVIQTASTGARLVGKVDLDDLQSKKGYWNFRAYGTSKLENILFTRELHHRFHSRGLSAVSFHPGVIASNFGSGSGGLAGLFMANKFLSSLFLDTPEKGAGRLARFAETEPDRDWVSGAYYEGDRPARRENPQGLDADLAQKLWEQSLSLLGLPEFSG
ncbi:MAG: SDR family NAD(P)-dependent oxidoreductase [Hyphomicrobiaceae bacterium]|nr:SDR family NAD(P)-dependent oxidoreductase [Hyphomicrobiaceae bacterium]